MKVSVFLVTTTLLLSTLPTWAQSSGVGVAEPTNAATATTLSKVKMVVNGTKVNPAGEIAAGTVHHHCIVSASSIKEGEVMPYLCVGPTSVENQRVPSRSLVFSA